MPTEMVTLDGDALHGLGAHLVPHALMSGLPQTVFLGRARPKARPQALRLSEYFDEGLMATPPPASVDYYTKAAVGLARMYRNDVQGCCVISDRMHSLAIWSANDPDATGIIQASDAEVDEQYRSICGPGDNGCNITQVLDVARSKGIKAGGVYYKIDGYVSLDWTNKTLVQAGVALFGTLNLGINLPSAWTSANIWDVTNTRIVGGHDVPGCGYGAKVLNTNSDGVVISSWGRLYLITWPAFLSRKWIEECYAILSPNWYNADKIAASGVDAATLRDDLVKIAGGTIPDVPDPNNEPPLDWFV